jgi:hypothetical protein
MALLFIGSAEAWCKEGFKSCDYNHQNGCETCVATDVNNCGDCKIKCAKYPYTIPTCSNGKCGAKCVDSWKDCNNNLKHDGCEVNVKSDAKNCGSCGNKCSYGAKCVNGKCESGCKPGWKDCNHDGKCEVDCGTDVNNCGSCGNKCKGAAYAIAKCSGGKCSLVCKSGWANCDMNWSNGCETDISKNIHNCGGCGKKCVQPKYFGGETVCSNGKCVEQCKKGMKYNSYKKCCV